MCNGRPVASRGVTSKRVLAAVGAAGAAFVVLIAAEIVVARGREYLVDVTYRVDRTVGADRGTAEPLELRVLGDSTAAGVGAATADGALPVLIAERVARRLGRPVHVVGLGVSGARTADVRERQLPRIGDGADAIVIVVGSNDVIHATPPRRLREQTRALVADARATGVPVVFGGVPRFAGVTAFAQPLRALADGYAAVQRDVQQAVVAQEPGVTFVDIAALASPRFAGRPEAFSRDAFHPSAVGYGFWADALAPAVVAAVTSGSAGSAPARSAG